MDTKADSIDSRTAATALPCPCCRHLTLESRGDYDICPVCFWEDDGDWDDPSNEVMLGGPNHMTLTEARVNYAEFGACERILLQYVRMPLPHELPPPPAVREGCESGSVSTVNEGEPKSQPPLPSEPW
jgi:hypothetical protein